MTAPAGWSLGAITNDSANITIVDTGAKSKWPPLARVSFSAFKSSGGGTEITEADVPAEDLRNLIHLKGAKEVATPLPKFPDKDATPKTAVTKSGSKPRSKPKPSPRLSKPKNASKPSGKPRPKPNLARMKTYRGIIVPETLLNAKREDLIERLSTCDKLFTPPRSISLQRIPVKDMDHSLATTDELRARCADVFYGPSNTDSPAQVSRKSASPVLESRKKIKRKLELTENENENETVSKKHAKVCDPSSQSQAIQDWFLANTSPSAPRQFILNRTGKRDVNWLVSVTVKDMSDARRL